MLSVSVTRLSLSLSLDSHFIFRCDRCHGERDWYPVLDLYAICVSISHYSCHFSTDCRVFFLSLSLSCYFLQVCEKVKLKGTTTYNEVADELVAEFSADPIASRAAFTGGFLPGDQEPFDQKNIRRRVYDALNVLMAMNIISKEKKEIKWIGLPTNAAQECQDLESEKERRLERIAQKKQQLRDLLLQQIAFKNLVERNKQVIPPPASNAIISLPFIVVNTDKKTVIDCSISNDKTEYLFNFDSTFEIHDDIEVLKRMGLALGLEKNDTTGLQICSVDVENARSMLAEGLRCELDEMLEEKNVVVVQSQGTRNVMTHKNINHRL